MLYLEKTCVWAKSKMSSYSVVLTYEHKSKPSFLWSIFQVFDDTTNLCSITLSKGGKNPSYLLLKCVR